MRSLLAAAALAASALTPSLLTPALAQEKPSDTKSDAKNRAEALKADVEKAWVRPPVEELASTSKGSVTVRGAKIGYTATAGTLTIRDDDGKPVASMFYTAYTRDGGGNRPVTFFYNGGPGSPTVWLHMGSFAPVRVATNDPVYVAPRDYAVRPNPDSLLDKTDLVFIDAIGAGWSRPLGDKTGKDFWGVDQDADAFARGIMRYVDKYNRWASPKVLFGESYGTLRSGAVGALLEERGMSVDGIVLLSTILNYGVRQPGYDQNYQILFPTYAATAWYHNRVPNSPANLEQFLADVRAFVAGPYAAALAKGDAVPDEEKRAVARQMAAYTGLSEDYILRSNLRISLGHFQTELLRDRGVATGRLDTRYLLNVADANADSPEDDPASTAITGAYFAGFRNYASQVLGYKSDMPYKLSARDGSFDWDWKHRAPGDRYPQPSPNTAVDLASTMRVNPDLKVLFLNGYFDAATPFYSTEYDVAHMGLTPELRKNISFRYYESGHMVYLNPRELTHMHDDVAAWYDQTTRR
ncbi:peptidase S10 [Novosphingobium olei]|uniref:S10 family peptidase n=1 Tax=Novosphingobium olei TaxID=2728851 RepID=UPI00308D9023|nr:peptidase S10 [Novosphingobium olei]